jgi:hypothetical protein
MCAASILYKYGSVDCVRYYLKENTVRIRDPLTYNDPFEFWPWFSKPRYKDVLRHNKGKEKWGKEVKALSRQFVDTFSDEDLEVLVCEHKRLLSKNIRVACFSEINDCLLMWAHYANEHAGVCFGFDTNKWQGAEFRRVTYSRRRLEWSFRDSVDPKRQPVNARRVSLTKSIHWKYEREFRLIVHNSGLPFPPHLTFPPEFIHSVYFGLRCDPQIIDDTMNLLASPIYRTVAAFRARHHAKDYKLEFTRLV